MMLGEAIEKVAQSDRIMIVNAAGQVIYRGFAANAHNAEIRKTRRVKRYGIGFETYRVTENMWDWSKIDTLPPQVPVEQLGEYPGGLVEHSNNVYRRLVMLAAAEDERMKREKPQYSAETLAIVGLLHDVCKADVYQKEDGKEDYSYNDPLPLGHGEKSVYRIMQDIFLTEEEAMAIRWHMGPYDKAAQTDFRDLDKAFNQCKLAVLLHLADMMATHLDEAEVEKK